MAWGASLISVAPSPQNPQNIVASVTFTHSVTNETFTLTPVSNDMSETWIKRWVATIINNLNTRDQSITGMNLLVGQNIAPEQAPVIDAGLLAFRKQWGDLKKLEALASKDATIVSQMDALKSAVEVYIKNNPNALDEVG